MADKEIADLTAAAALDGTELAHIIQGGNSRKVPVAGLAGSLSQNLAGFSAGTPAESALLLQAVFPITRYIPINAAGSQAYAAVAATAETVFDIQKNGVSIGSLTFAAAGQTGTFSIAAEATFVAGDRIALIAPASADATLADVSFAIVLNGAAA